MEEDGVSAQYYNVNFIYTNVPTKSISTNYILNYYNTSPTHCHNNPFNESQGMVAATTFLTSSLQLALATILQSHSISNLSKPLCPLLVLSTLVALL